MAVIKAEGVSEQSREVYLRELFQKAREQQGQSARVELGQIAAGRTDLPLARELFNKLENPEQKPNG